MVISILSFELLKNKLIVTPAGEGIGLVPKKKVLTENEAKTEGTSFFVPRSGTAYSSKIFRLRNHKLI
jgi:hypothetical protein